MSDMIYSIPDPTVFDWKVSDAKSERPPYRLGEDRIEEYYTLTVWNVPQNGVGYANPDVRIRCVVSLTKGVWRCDIFVAWGVTAGMANPNPQLYYYNADVIAAAFESSTWQAFPKGNVWLHTQAEEPTQLLAA